MEPGGGSNKRLMYTPHLKKVLKSYQASATKSLHGPNSVMGAWSESDDATSVSPPHPLSTDFKEKDPAGDVAKKSSAAKPGPSSAKDPVDHDPFIAPPPFPIQQPPIFTPADQTRCEKSETKLENEVIACFNVGGEDRLCLPQILNTVLRDFSLQQINCVCDTLHIYCSRCNQDQLEVLKSSGILPFNAPSCGLITKTDAQRLCAALLDCNPLIVSRTDAQPPFQIKVYHECFGKCWGVYTPDLYQHPQAPCIECLQCHALLSPEKFVCHVHHPTETRTCHWGFEVSRWEAYVLLEMEDDDQQKQALREMKERFSSKYKRKQILEESCDPSQKRVRVDNCFPYPYGMDPMLVYYYSQSHLWENAYQAFPSVITKDGKALYIPPDSFPQLIQKSLHNFRNRLPLSAADLQKLIPPMKIPEEQQTVYAYHAQKMDPTSKQPHIKKDFDHDSISCLDSEDAFSDTSFSTLSAGTEDGLVSNLDDDDEPPAADSELGDLRNVLNDVDASLRTKIISEVETIVAKYRKCLNVTMQGKKLYQMELEKIHCTHRAKQRKLREKNRSLQKEIQKLRDQTSGVPEQSNSQTADTVPKPPHSTSPHSSHGETTTIDNSELGVEIPPEADVSLDHLTEKTASKTGSVSASHPTLPKQQLAKPETESLTK